MAKEEVSERKRISIPKIDRSSLDWWASQADPGLSVRMLIRAEIERNGYADVVNAPVTQQPRRGRPAGQSEAAEAEAPPAAEAVAVPSAAPAAAAPAEPIVTAPPVRPEPVLVGAGGGGVSPIDSIMGNI